MTYRLKEDRNAAMRRWYSLHREAHIKRVKRRKAEIKAWLRGYKAMKGCVHCQERDPNVLDFHHKNDKEKCFRLSNCVNLKGFAQIQAEVQKCDIYCSNYHRKYHKHWRSRGRITPDKKLSIAFLPRHMAKRYAQ